MEDINHFLCEKKILVVIRNTLDAYRLLNSL